MDSRQKNTLKTLIYFGVIVLVIAFIKGGDMMKYGLIDGLTSSTLSFKPIIYNIRFTVVVAVFYVCFAAYIYYDKGNERDDIYGPREIWEDIKKLAGRYGDPKDETYNKYFTRNFKLSYDNRFARRNTNTVLSGVPGTGKSNGYAIANLLYAGCSFIDIDPKGEHLETCGYRFEKLGYRVTVLNLENFDNSDCYNPFKYINAENYQRDIENLVDVIFSSADNQTKVKQNTNKMDPFWETSAKDVMLAIMYYVYFEYPENKRHFGSVMEIKRLCGEITVNEQTSTSTTKADPIFDALAKKDPDHIALRYWRQFVSCEAKVKKDILSTLNSKLTKFNNDKLIELTRFDDMDLSYKIGVEKRIIFIVIPATDPSLNFIVSIFYTQLFDILFKQSAKEFGNKGMPRHIEIMMDEFYNIKLPDQFENYLALMRGYNISATIMLQNLTQLKGVFDKESETIMANCDEFLFLGAGNDNETPEYVSKLLGKYTLDTRNTSESKGAKGGSDSVSHQHMGRERMTPEEIRRLDNNRAIVCVRGELPIVDDKIWAWELPEDIIKYSSFDKKTGKKYVKKATDVFPEYDLSKATIVPPGELSDTPCYFFVTGTEISERLAKIRTDAEADEKDRIRDELNESAYQRRASRRNVRK